MEFVNKEKNIDQTLLLLCSNIISFSSSVSLFNCGVPQASILSSVHVNRLHIDFRIILLTSRALNGLGSKNIDLLTPYVGAGPSP